MSEDIEGYQGACMQLMTDIFSGIGATLLIYSTFSKKKENILWVQTVSLVASVISYLLVGSYSAMLTCMISIIRNILTAKGRMTPRLLVIMTCTIIILGLCTNTRGLIGLLPIIASIEYTIWAAKGTTAQSLLWALVVNTGLWLAHDICVSLYLFVVMDLVTLLVTTINIIRYKPK